MSTNSATTRKHIRTLVCAAVGVERFINSGLHSELAAHLTRIPVYHSRESRLQEGEFRKRGILNKLSQQEWLKDCHRRSGL